MSQTIAPRIVTKDSSSTCPPLIAHSCFRGRLRGLDCKFNNTAVIVIARYVLMSRHALGIDLGGRGYDGWTPAGRLVWRFPCPLPSPLTPTTHALHPTLSCMSVAMCIGSAALNGKAAALRTLAELGVDLGAPCNRRGEAPATVARKLGHKGAAEAATVRAAAEKTTAAAYDPIRRRPNEETKEQNDPAECL